MIVIVKRIALGPLEANCYIVNLEGSSNAFIIDPGYGPEEYIKYIKENRLNPLGIVLTHLHSDHVGGADDLSRKLSLPIYMGRIEGKYYDGHVDRNLDEGDVLSFEEDGRENSDFVVIHSPGHSRGGICLYSEKERVAFTGDTLFDTDLGRTDLVGGSEKALVDTIITKLDKWEDDVFIYPGHDTGATMGQVRKYNREFIDIVKKGRR